MTRYYVIKWRENQQSTYLYGSQLIWQKEAVHVTNQLMPSGLSFHEWQSRTNYQRDRREPELPLLRPGKTYQLELVSDLLVGSLPYLQIICYDRWEQELVKITIKEGRGDFVYPTETYDYHIRLINAGCQSFRFHQLVLREVD
ncbi:accessory Sec system protein Asp3 [Streptococcus cuniculipharyngis]|uniref:Accessory Sec system protein Asp3 n=1 Tax=Streptococcus cuniculipharyngis TaxID=1562651 RepID=A0A5C5SFH3_9STRE|nr:accessory Sec system protein Asp3 [Streptococcus cuniculipharyngis]TWS98893.1 accessory Sec system protein Asp3 [Streptococcus cuniculipharyngis]